LRLPVDENLAPRLAADLADLFPGSVHVASLGMGATPDAVLWRHAKENQFTFLLQTGNCSTFAVGN